MEELYNLGLSDNTIKTMIELNPEILELTNEKFLEQKSILEKIGCSNSQIINIISSNPMYLSKTKSEINNLVNYLEKIGFGSLNILFDSNPYILNLEEFEIEKYINQRINDDKNIEDIIDELDSDPSLFFDI